MTIKNCITKQVKGGCCTVKHTPTLPCLTLSSSAERVGVGNRMGTGMEIGNRNCETGICAKSCMGRDKMTACRDIVLKYLQESLGAHGDLVHKLRCTTMDFEFHLPFVFFILHRNSHNRSVPILCRRRLCTVSWLCHWLVLPHTTHLGMSVATTNSRLIDTQS